MSGGGGKVSSGRVTVFWVILFQKTRTWWLNTASRQQGASRTTIVARASHACYTANRSRMATAEDLWAERFARVLWVRGGDVPRPWPALRAQCVRTRAGAALSAGPLLLGYDVAHEAELQRERQA